MAAAKLSSAASLGVRPVGILVLSNSTKAMTPAALPDAQARKSKPCREEVHPWYESLWHLWTCHGVQGVALRGP